MPDVNTETPPAAVMPGVRFTVASRPQRRFANTQTVSNLAGPTSFQPIQLPATGFVRKLSLYFVASMTSASAAALVNGDAPFNLINAITLTDATGQPIVQPISGYNLYLVNKYLGFGTGDEGNSASFNSNPVQGPEFTYTTNTTTAGNATFRLDLDLEQDFNSGYGSIPNLDSNASLQLKIDVAQYTNAWTGTTVSAASMSVRVTQWYWAPVSATVGGVTAQTQPVGFGDYLETRYETQTVSAATENLVNVSNRGGMIKGIIAVSRNAGVRTAYTAASNVGCLIDNNPVDEGVLLEEQLDYMRRRYGLLGADFTTTYGSAALTQGTLQGLDRGVLVFPFATYSGGRDSWMITRVGSLFQLKITPGASATSLELITQLAQVKDATAFYAPSALA